MKKFVALILALLLIVSLATFAGCSSQTEDPGAPPSDVIGGTASGNSSPYDGEVLENAVSVRIGQGKSKDWAVNMYNNAASVTMLDYLSGSPLLFPTYPYEEE